MHWGFGLTRFKADFYVLSTIIAIFVLAGCTGRSKGGPRLMMLYDIALPDNTLVLPRVFFICCVYAYAHFHYLALQ